MLKFWFRINITILECKFESFCVYGTISVGINITILECKCGKLGIDTVVLPCINITILECKFDFPSQN